MADDEILAAMARLSRSLTPGDLEHTLRQITDTAVAVLPGVAYSSITVLHKDGRLETVAPTDDLVLEVDAAQFELQEGPCYEAAIDQTYLASSNLPADERFPRYGQVAAKAGIRGQAGIRLFETPRPAARGALNLYSRSVGTFDELGMLSGLYAQQSAVAIEYARHTDDLLAALATRKTIGMAVGIVMERYSMNEQRAFAFLTRLSQDSNTKLRDIAAHVIENLEAPGQP